MNQSVYQGIADLLKQTQYDSTPAEINGLLLAYHCIHQSQAGTTDHGWIEILTHAVGPIPEDKRLVAALSAMAEAARNNLNDPEYGLSLMLPEDDVDLSHRSLALSEWCTGFLSGLGLASKSQQKPFKGQVSEYLQDLERIARVCRQQAVEVESEASAFEEISEYVRAGTFIVFEAMRAPQPKRVLN